MMIEYSIKNNLIEIEMGMTDLNILKTYSNPIYIKRTIDASDDVYRITVYSCIIAILNLNHKDSFKIQSQFVCHHFEL